MKYLGIAITDWIETAVAVVTMLAALISLWQSRKSLKLTQESIKSTSRPYLSIYVEQMDTVAFQKYIVLKNFGASSATIKSIKFNGSLDELNKGQLQSVINSSIAPGQKLTSSVKNDFTNTVIAEVTYTDSQNETYIESYTLKFDALADLAWTKSTNSKDSDIATAIKHSAQSILKTIK